MKKNKQKWSFCLNDIETERLEKWQKKIKKKHGKYGSFTFMFTPTGISDVVTVYSELEDKTKNITDYSCW